MRPDRGGKTVVDPIGALHHLVDVAPARNGKDGSEDFLAPDSHRGRNIGEYGGTHPISGAELVALRTFAARRETRSLSPPAFDVGKHLAQLTCRIQRAHLAFLAHRIADAQ